MVFELGIAFSSSCYLAKGRRVGALWSCLWDLVMVLFLYRVCASPSMSVESHANKLGLESSVYCFRVLVASDYLVT